MRSKVQVRFIVGIVGSNPTDGMDVRLLCFVVCRAGSGICDGMITHSEESYRVCRVFVCVCEIVCNLGPSAARRSRTDLGWWATDK